MSEEYFEKLEMILGLGTLGIALIFYIGLAIVCFVISSKKKKTDPKDSKTWKTLGTILVVVGAVAALGAGAAFIIPAVLSANMAVFII